MKLGDRLAEGLATDEPHGVERLVVFLAAGQLVDRHDVGMFELAGDLRFLEEPSPVSRVRGRLGLDLLERDLAVEVGVAGEPDLAEAPLGMQPGQSVPQSASARGAARASRSARGPRLGGRLVRDLRICGDRWPGWRRAASGPATSPREARRSRCAC